MKSVCMKAGIVLTGAIISSILFSPWFSDSKAHAFAYISNSHPLFVGIASPPLLSAKPENEFLMSVNYSSTYLVRSSGEWVARIDLETLLVDIVGSFLVSDTTEVRLRVPLVSYNSGFLDGFLEEYHDTFGFSDYGRSYRPKNEYLFLVTHNGREVIRGKEGGLEPGDMSLGLKQQLLDGPAIISAYGYIEFPTGDPEKGYGNGSLDYGIMILADLSLARTLTGYINLGYVSPGTYRAYEDIHLREYRFGALGLEWSVTGNFSALVQMSMQSSPYDTGIRQIDATASVLTLAGVYELGKHSTVELSFAEDPGVAGSPDFMVNTAFKYRF